MNDTGTVSAARKCGTTSCTIIHVICAHNPEVRLHNVHQRSVSLFVGALDQAIDLFLVSLVQKLVKRTVISTLGLAGGRTKRRFPDPVPQCVLSDSYRQCSNYVAHSQIVCIRI